eukprot:g10544.t1
MDGLEGPSALPFAATFLGQMLLAMWKGVAPLLAHHAATGIARIAESHAAMGRLPPPQLSERRLAVGGTDWRLVVGHHVDDRKRKDEKGLD